MGLGPDSRTSHGAETAAARLPKVADYLQMLRSMSQPTTPTHTAFRYMTRFRCIGSACESSCCTGGWGIGIDRTHFEKLRSAMGKNPALRQEFDTKVTRVKGVARSDAKYGLMVLQSNGDCSFLAQDRLCSVQQRYGEGVLPDTCSVYPRTVVVAGQRRELAGLPSCPEVTRQLLLQPDAMDLVEVSAELFPRSFVTTRMEEHPADPYVRYHDELRNLMFDLLSDDAYPLSSRLSVMAYFANRTVEFLHHGVQSLDEERLLAEVERIQDLTFRVGLHEQFQKLPVDAAFPSRVVLALLSDRSHVDGFRQLLGSVIVQYEGNQRLLLKGTGDELETRVAEIVRVYAEHKKTWERFAPQIDRYFTNFAKNYWAQEMYARSPNLLTHSVQLLVRLAVLHFMLMGHPLLLATAHESDAVREDALARATVETVQKFSRAFGHSPGVTKAIQERLADSNVISLAHAACLARF